jgi:hypothetical protein
MKPIIMVGYVSRDYQTHKQTPNDMKLAIVEDYVQQHFWTGSLYIHNREQLVNQIFPYPECFAAGWYVKEEGGEIKQTVLLVHGNSLLDARNQLNIQASKVEW